MQSQQRQTAVKARVSDLLKGKYVVQEGWEPNYILIKDKKVSRVNLIGVVVSKQSSEDSGNETIVVDDGTGRVSTKSFEDVKFSNVAVGDVITLIGRPREYGGEVYIVPEIMRSLDDKRWANVRLIELEMSFGKTSTIPEAEESIQQTNAQEPKQEKIELSEENILEESAESESIEDSNISPIEKILKLVKDYDGGDGADFQEIVDKSEIRGAESIINELLKNGDIFELKPGKLKIL